MEKRTEPAFGPLLRILRVPLIRLLLLGWAIFYLYISGHMFRGAFVAGPAGNLAVVVWMVGLTLALYVGFVRVVEGRPASELAVMGMGRELGLGLLLGAGLYTLCVLILMALGIYRIEGLGDWHALFAMLWFALSSSFFEEMLFRGVLLRVTAEMLGSWSGLVVSALAFGLVHLNNEGSTLQGVMFIAIEFGVLLGAAFILTGRLWLGMGIHMAWNFTQSAVFSGAGSGNEASRGLIRASIQGPDLLTGGAFGMEASLVPFVICTTLGVAWLVLAARRGRIMPPDWMRRG